MVQEQDARLGKVVGRAHDGVPQLARRQGLVDPQAVAALASAFGDQAGTRAGFVHKVPRLIVLQRVHEAVGHAHRDVEIVPAPGLALGGDEVQHVRMVDAQNAHLRATSGAGALNRRAGLVEHVDVAARPRGHGMRALDLSPARADARKVVAHAATAAHGFGRFAQRFVDARVAVFINALDAVAHRLHKAVDQSGLDVGAGGAHDAAGADGACLQIGQEARFVHFAQAFGFHRGQGAGHAAEQVFDAGFAGFEVFFLQHVIADRLGVGQAFRPVVGFAFHSRILEQMQQVRNYLDGIA